jgi:predicted RNase H-like nuclease (RuvC/YqgF family)|tara:strand:+ start:488 stop:727 length:240 start_codon:yes stop_codon:yes gene_type:complete
MVISKESLIQKFTDYIDTKEKENEKLRRRVDNLKESLSGEQRNYEDAIRKNKEIAKKLKSIQSFFYAVSSEAKAKGRKL